MINKKGLSTVVTTLIIILLVLVAIGIVWVVIRGVIESGSEQIDVSAKCPLVDIKISSSGVCGNTTAIPDCTYTISRGSSGEETGVFYRVAAFDGTNTATADGLEIGPLITRTETVTLSSAINNATEISVTPFFRVNGVPKLCSNSNTYQVP